MSVSVSVPAPASRALVEPDHRPGSPAPRPGPARPSTRGRNSSRHLDLGVLDALRGLAALYVVLGHASGMLWAGLDATASSDERGPGLALAYAMHHLLRWPHEAVLLFFLLSGFCIHYRQARRLHDNDVEHPSSPPAWRGLLHLGTYAERRLRRLYPPLVLALALTALFDAIGSQLNPAFYATLTLPPSSTGPGPDHAISTLIGNLLMQASFVVPAFGTNGPLWSLAFEAWFYLLYPLVLLASARLGARGMLAATAVVSLAGLLAMPASTPLPGESLAAYQAGGSPEWIPVLLMYWVVWSMGAFVAEVYVGRASLPGLRWLAPLSVVALGVLMITLGQFLELPGGWRWYDLAWGAGLAVLLATLLVALPHRLGSSIERTGRMLRPLGAISYSLYVVHLPWLVLVSAWWLSGHAELPRGAELAAPGVLSALGLAAVCWYCVERHCVSARTRSAAADREPRPHSSGRSGGLAIQMEHGSDPSVGAA